KRHRPPFPAFTIAARTSAPWRDRLTAVLHQVAGVVAELGGSTSHLAALTRERGIPAVLGVIDATRRIPEGATVAVDGVAGVVRWLPRRSGSVRAEPRRPLEGREAGREVFAAACRGLGGGAELRPEARGRQRHAEP